MKLHAEFLKEIVSTNDFGGTLLALHRVLVPDWDDVVKYSGVIEVDSDALQVLFDTYPGYRDILLDFLAIIPP